MTDAYMKPPHSTQKLSQREGWVLGEAGTHPGEEAGEWSHRGPPGRSDAEVGLEAEEGGPGARWAGDGWAVSSRQWEGSKGSPDGGAAECCWGVRNRTL